MEELKIVIEAMANLGEEAKTAFILWVLCRYALLYLLVTSGILVVIYFIRDFAIYWVDGESFIQEIKDLLEIKGTLNQSERERILNIIKKGAL